MPLLPRPPHRRAATFCSRENFSEHPFSSTRKGSGGGVRERGEGPKKPPALPRRNRLTPKPHSWSSRSWARRTRRRSLRPLFTTISFFWMLYCRRTLSTSAIFAPLAAAGPGPRRRRRARRPFRLSPQPPTPPLLPRPPPPPPPPRANCSRTGSRPRLRQQRGKEPLQAAEDPALGGSVPPRAARGERLTARAAAAAACRQGAPRPPGKRPSQTPTWRAGPTPGPQLIGRGDAAPTYGARTGALPGARAGARTSSSFPPPPTRPHHAQRARGRRQVRARTCAGNLGRQFPERAMGAPRTGLQCWPLASLVWSLL